MSSLTESQLATAYVVERTIEDTHCYLLEGRQYAELSDEELADAWVMTLRDLASTGFTQEAQWGAIRDIESELGLRRIAIPLDRAEPELALFVKHIERERRKGRPDWRKNADYCAELAELRERLARPKH
jgi:hypothetical protein